MRTLPLAALVLLSAAGVAAAPKAPAALVCPVTGEKIASRQAAAAHETYKGRTYYFCCPDCKPKFDKDPAKVSADASHGKFQK